MQRRRELHYEVRFEQPPPVVWAILADTERLNQAMGTPFAPYTAVERLDADGRVVRHATKRIGPITLRWRERFGEWVENRMLHQERHFQTGPFEELSLTVTLEASGTGTVMHADFVAVWTGFLGNVLAAAGVLPKITRPLIDTVEAMIADAGREPGAAPSAVAYRPQTAAEIVRSRLDAAVGAIERGGHGHGLAARLGEHLLNANPLDLRRIRPLALARDWGVPEEDVVEVVLAAHRADLLSMRWEVMCPRCRGTKTGTASLSELSRHTHCESCQIDYERDFENNVELVFAPEPWLRQVPSAHFCMMGPASVPHIRLQCELAAGQTRTEELDLPEGRYRLRTVEPGEAVEIDHRGGPFPEVMVTEDGAAPGNLGAPGSVTMANYAGVPRTAVVETTAWSNIALTGAKVIASQAFRDLCPEQLLHPGDEVAIGRVSILFSDLKGSTALYERIGDARAYSLVRAHFDFMAERVHRNRGAIVKTIGDAVMAVFPRAADALAAALDIQDGVAAFNAGRGDDGIVLKIGLHAGPCIAVTAGGVLDYFGTNVNIAARLQGASRGGEIVLSDRMLADAGARSLLDGRQVRPERIALAGIADETPCHRVLCAV